DDQAMQVDAGARQSIAVGKLTQSAKIRVDLGLEHRGDALVARRAGEAAPQPAARRSFLSEQAEPDLPRDGRDDCPAMRSVRPRREWRARDPGVSRPAPRAAYPSSHWSSAHAKKDGHGLRRNPLEAPATQLEWFAPDAV